MNIIMMNKNVEEIDTILKGEVFDTFSSSAKHTNPNGQNMSMNITTKTLKVMNSRHFLIFSLFEGFLQQSRKDAVIPQTALNARRRESLKELNSIMFAIS